jgi:hypothetical protein
MGVRTWLIGRLSVLLRLARFSGCHKLTPSGSSSAQQGN